MTAASKIAARKIGAAATGAKETGARAIAAKAANKQWSKNGSPGLIRTGDHSINSRTLYR